MKILCIEDDENLGELLKQTLQKQHYSVDLATDGEIGWNLVEVITYDLILLDLQLPKLDGINFCKKLRLNNNSTLAPNLNTPVLLMTAIDTVTNKIKGLDAGADDYVVKPFNLDELLARIRALIRRTAELRTPILTWGELSLNLNKCEVTYQGQPVKLTAKEYEILELFLRNPEQIFSLERLLDRLWAFEQPPTEGAVRAHIKGLRQKLKLQGVEDPLQTFYKLGYRLKNPPTNESKNLTQQNNLTSNIPVESPVKTPQTENNITNENSVELEIQQGIWQIWLNSRHSYYERLKIVSEAVKALKQGTLTPQQQHQAEREVHTLIGSLGSFGLEEASSSCREMQIILKQTSLPGETEVTRLEQLTEAVYQQMKQKKSPFSLDPPEDGASEKIEGSDDEKFLLVINENLSLAEQICSEAIKWGFNCKITPDLDFAQEFLKTQSPDVIVLNLKVAGSSENKRDFNELDFLALVQSQYPHILVVILTAETDFAIRLKAVKLGGKCFLKEPISGAQVLTVVNQLLEKAKFKSARLLMVDDDSQFLALLETLLKPCGYEITLLDNPLKFWETLEEVIPDLLILDLDFSGICPVKYPNKDTTTTASLTGLDLCQVIRADYRWNRLPILILSAHNDQETIHQALAVGADDFLSKPIISTELTTRVQFRLQQRKDWEIMEIDELTGLSLRRKTLQDLSNLLYVAKKHQQPFSLALVDLDHFKTVNDQYGHESGDRVLNYLGQILRQSFTKKDVVGRFGGEEFLIGIYNSLISQTLERLNEVLLQIRQHKFFLDSGKSFTITFSAGVAQYPDHGKDIEILYHQADVALYQAKSQGRNSIVSAISVS